MLGQRCEPAISRSQNLRAPVMTPFDPTCVAARMGTNSLQREIEELATRLAPASGGRTLDELARIRRDLASGGERESTIELPSLRLGFACKQRWEDMVGDDRVRACGGCDRPVFNLSAMTREEAERVLATRGLTPCVRFYRRPDGTVMTTDCPAGERREKRRLAVVASSLATGATVAAPSLASAAPADPAPPVATPDSTEEAATPDPATQTTPDVGAVTTVDTMPLMGVPIREYELGVMFVEPRPRPAVEWSIWGRLGRGVRTQPPTVLARSLTPPQAESSAMWEAAVAAEVTVGVAHHGNLRLGAWAELRTSSGAVAGSELVVEGLPPHPLSSRIGGAGTIVLRAGGNAHVITTALGVGYVGSWPRDDPWIRWAKHLAGARIVASLNRSLDDPREWSALFGLEVEPLGAVHAVLDLATGR